MKSGCLLLVMIVMLFLTFISIKQGYNTLFHENWDDNYLKEKAVVTAIFKDSAYVKSLNTYSYSYTFKPVVSYRFNQKILTDTLIWHMSVERPDFYPGDSIDVVIHKASGELTEAVEQDRIGTGVVNLLQGLFFGAMAYFMYKYLKKIRRDRLKSI